MPCCCVRRCTNRSETKKKGADGITFHLFPRDEAKRKKWMRAVGRKEWAPSNASVVCSQHFAPSCFYNTKSGLVRLFDDSVPSLRLGHNNKVKLAAPPAAAEVAVEGEGERRHEGRRRLAADLPLLRAPVLAPDAPPEARQLATNIRRLLFMCKKQRKCIRSLQRELRERDEALRRRRHPQLRPDELRRLVEAEGAPDEEAEAEGAGEGAAPPDDDPYWA